MRTKQCQLIGRAPCTEVTPVEIYPYARLVKRNDHYCTYNELRILAYLDGFDNRIDFFEFFKRYEKYVLEDFEIIEWDPDRLTT